MKTSCVNLLYEKTAFLLYDGGERRFAECKCREVGFVVGKCFAVNTGLLSFLLESGGKRIADTSRRSEERREAQERSSERRSI
jgi:hypothetical protein